MALKAYFVRVVDGSLPDVVQGANTPGQAKAQAQRAAKDAGYDVPFVEFRATRTPGLDGLVQTIYNRFGPADAMVKATGLVEKAAPWAVDWR